MYLSDKEVLPTFWCYMCQCMQAYYIRLDLRFMTFDALLMESEKQKMFWNFACAWFLVGCLFVQDCILSNCFLTEDIKIQNQTLLGRKMELAYCLDWGSCGSFLVRPKSGPNVICIFSVLWKIVSLVCYITQRIWLAQTISDFFLGIQMAQRISGFLFSCSCSVCTRHVFHGIIDLFYLSTVLFCY